MERIASFCVDHTHTPVRLEYFYIAMGVFRVFYHRFPDRAHPRSAGMVFALGRLAVGQAIMDNHHAAFVQMRQRITDIAVCLRFEVQAVDEYDVVFFSRISGKEIVRSHPVGQIREKPV